MKLRFIQCVPHDIHLYIVYVCQPTPVLVPSYFPSCTHSHIFTSAPVCRNTIFAHFICLF